MAFRGYLDDLEHEDVVINNIINGMVAIMRSLGNKEAKKVPLPKERRKRLDDETDELPDIGDVIQSLGGAGTVID